MATTPNYVLYGTIYGRRVPIESMDRVSYSSKVGKRVDLRKQNPHTFYLRKLVGATYGPLYRGTPSPEGVAFMHNACVEADWIGFEQIALAKFIGKLRKGSASMGVTLASWRQSRDMIVDRLTKVRNVLSKAEKKLSKDRKRRKELSMQGYREARASDVLEVEFGWRPLFEDLKACLTTVCQDGIPPSWVTGVHKFVHTRSWSQGTFYRMSARESGRVTVAANVEVSNPNLWLLNRMGLINPLTVIWDLVPWSFVVNMFLNVNAMINAVTQYVGLTIKNKSVTRSSSTIATRRLQLNDPQAALGEYLDEEYYYRFRTRTVGSLPTQRWSVKVPQFNWELALIAGSLLVQQASRITKLIFKTLS